MRKIIIGDALEAITDAAGGAHVRCARCGHVYGPVTENPKLHALVERGRVTDIPGVGDPARYALDVELEFRRFHCPGCGVQFETELAKPGEPPLWDTELHV